MDMRITSFVNEYDKKIGQKYIRVKMQLLTLFDRTKRV